jgi:hypothetical protein
MKGEFMEFARKGAIAPILTLLSALFLAGCGGANHPAPSTSYATSAIYAFMKAVQDESGNVTTTVQLRDGLDPVTARYLYLAGGETLYTSLDISPRQYLSFTDNLFGNSLDLSQYLKVMGARDLYTEYFLFNQIVLGKPEYYSVNTPTAGSSPVRAYVDFERAGNVLAGETSIVLPAAFQILAPASGASVTRATPVTLTWSNVDATATMRLDVAVICDDGLRNTLNRNLGADTGTTTLNSADYLPAGVSASATCQVAFILQRVHSGAVSPNFAFGSIEGLQRRTVQFTTTP